MATSGRRWEERMHGVPSAQRADEVPDLADLDGVEPDGGLVEDEDVRVAEQRLGDAHPLPEALGEVRGQPVEHLRPRR